MDKVKFKHNTQVRVRNYEIDWQGIVHNVNYLLYFEVGRVSYLEHLGIKVDVNTIQHELRIVVVRNEVDYRSPARYGELINVYTRISSIRNSSFVFEGILEEASTKRLLAENVSVHVWLNHRTYEPVRVSDEFRALVRNFEGVDVVITLPSYFT